MNLKKLICLIGHNWFKASESYRFLGEKQVMTKTVYICKRCEKEKTEVKHENDKEIIKVEVEEKQ